VMSGGVDVVECGWGGILKWYVAGIGRGGLRNSDVCRERDSGRCSGFRGVVMGMREKVYGFGSDGWLIE